MTSKKDLYLLSDILYILQSKEKNIKKKRCISWRKLNTSLSGICTSFSSPLLSRRFMGLIICSGSGNSLQACSLFNHCCTYEWRKTIIKHKCGKDEWWSSLRKTYTLPCPAFVPCQLPLLAQPLLTCWHHLLSHDCKWICHTLVRRWYMPLLNNS